MAGWFEYTGNENASKFTRSDGEPTREEIGRRWFLHTISSISVMLRILNKLHKFSIGLTRDFERYFDLYIAKDKYRYCIQGIDGNDNHVYLGICAFVVS